MSDALKHAEAIGRIVSTPVVYWQRAEDKLALDESGSSPLYVVPTDVELAEIFVVMGSAVGALASDASFSVSIRRGAAVPHTMSSAFHSSWSTSKTVVSQPKWNLRAGDILFSSVSKSGMGALLPSMLLGVALKPT